MSLITRCPACTTIFKVVPDQLRVSEGWVRCGQCDEVFDANAHLQTVLPTEVAEQVPISPQEPALAPEQTAEVVDEYDWEWLDSHSGVIADDAVVDPDLIDTPAPDPVSPEGEPELIVAQAFIEPVLAAPPAAEVGVDVPQSPPEESPVDLVEPPAFMRGTDSNQASSGQRRVQGGLWLVCACLLAALFPLQWVMQERDRISASAPSLQPILEWVCVAAGCKISPMQSIDAVVIESSAFSKLQADAYLLSFSLKSTALVNIAAPSLELTLTDLQDQPLVRRVFSPDELGRSNRLLMPGVEWTGAKTIVIGPSPVVSRIAGYRLLAFYP
jgi:predicted Zn finger-like uncharacterized protein